MIIASWGKFCFAGGDSWPAVLEGDDIKVSDAKLFVSMMFPFQPWKESCVSKRLLSRKLTALDNFNFVINFLTQLSRSPILDLSGG